MGNYVHYMYGMSGFAEKLKIENCVINQVNTSVYYLDLG